MKKIGIIIVTIIGSVIIATAATAVSPAVVRTEVLDPCHVYENAGFPLSFIETLLDQPSKDECLRFALSKSYPTFNFQNLAIDWVFYFVLAVGGFSVVIKRRRHKTQ